MTIQTHGATRSPVVAACVILLGLFVLWMAQPVLAGWGCATSFRRCALRICYLFVHR